MGCFFIDFNVQEIKYENTLKALHISSNYTLDTLGLITVIQGVLKVLLNVIFVTISLKVAVYFSLMLRQIDIDKFQFAEYLRKKQNKNQQKFEISGKCIENKADWNVK